MRITKSIQAFMSGSLFLPLTFSICLSFYRLFLSKASVPFSDFCCLLSLLVLQSPTVLFRLPHHEYGRVGVGIKKLKRLTEQMLGL